MKLVLLKDVPSLGKMGAVVDVADGYARNFLVPRGHAVEASKGALALAEAQKRAKSRREAESLAEAQALAKLLESQPLDVPARSGGNGKLFGAVTNANVAEAIAATFSVEVDRHKIELPESIKSLGSYPVEIRLAKSVVAKTTVRVVAAS